MPSVQTGTRIAVFCGARPGATTKHLALAEEFGAAMGRRSLGLVYGAGGVGVMGTVARTALRHGVSVTGVIPTELHERERSDAAPGEIFVVRSMHERKALMYRLSHAFAVLPGGLGTLDELMEVATWNQLGMHSKPTVLVNASGYFDPLLSFLDHVVREGFLTSVERDMVRSADDVEEALDLLAPDSREVDAGPALAGQST
ncbi:LOG family protein [Streptomyces viridochromogenes]|uniref:Cytokinin riboside 5'-monophosphate phosphoribohydrolase n=1 Tax=Streptomyces viridochromogenes TaxID=1938 RepID=A0A0J7Z7N8_STRVR|nr:TIGR00730 family Rossman fold protein [Streptomyces viridochromogenes]KMS71198.1 LOG family protein [Streptomyces viridochromogenes]KOG18033.1 LOG family protein [Streptomyces viridochromogenes]KOG18696.1 LOG family protein [Streptomyces viridochromogenes]